VDDASFEAYCFEVETAYEKQVDELRSLAVDSGAEDELLETIDALHLDLAALHQERQQRRESLKTKQP
jgi:hypothetical protein